MSKSESKNITQDALLQQIKKQENLIENLKSQLNQLNTENFQLKNLIDNLPGDIYWKNTDGIWSGVNKRGAQSLLKMGFIHDRSDVIGKSDYQLFSKETADEYRKNDLEVLKLKTEIAREEVNLLPDGEKIVQLSTKRPLWDKDGNVVGIVGNTIDISYLKKIETELNAAISKAEAANQAKTEFLSNMRHDIRTPLSGIIGFSELMKSESKEAHIKEYADNLVASSHALLHLMDEVLEAVRVSSGEIPMLKRKFNISHLFEQVIALCKARAIEKQLNLSLELDTRLPNFAIGDKIRLHRIALELVSNALNFTDDGFVTLAVKLARKENRNIIIKMKVTDSGMGIPEDKQQDIYVQFKRLTPSYQGIYKGAGLGLFVVKQFIDELEGEIYVESEPHKGTCFTCIIPLQESLLDDASGIDETRESRLDKPYLEPLTHQLQTISETSSEKSNLTKVLVVEDNIIARSVAQIIMSSLNCHVETASNGEEALACCQKNSYDLILMDIGLGDDMDGYDVTRHIRNQHDNMQHTPIIALTAHGGDENKQRCIEAGMNAVLTKPLTKVQAADILKTFVPARKPIPTPEIKPPRRDLPDTDLELFQMDQFSLFDKDQGIKNSGSKGMLIELLTIMVADIPKDLQGMQAAFVNKDYQHVEHLAHKIKGGAVYVGTTRLKYACQYLERYWKSGERELFGELYRQMIKIMEETGVSINEWLLHNK